MSQATENLRFLLWRDHVERKDWATHLAAWAKSGTGRAEDLLSGAELQPDEQEAIAGVVQISVEELVGTSLVITSGVNILQENIQFLTDNMSHGEKKRLCAAID